MPDRLMATIWSQPSTETFLKLRFGRLMPALLTRMSMRPWRLRTAAAIFATSGLSATSTASASPLPAALSCFSAAASVSLLRPEMTTCAPARASSIAPASPMPEPPPVIQATLPASILSGAEEYFRLLLAEAGGLPARSEEHTSELQSRLHLVCRLLLEKKKNKKKRNITSNTKKRESHDY